MRPWQCNANEAAFTPRTAAELYKRVLVTVKSLFCVHCIDEYANRRLVITTFGRPRRKPQPQAATANEAESPLGGPDASRNRNPQPQTKHCIALHCGWIALHCGYIALHCDGIALHCDCIALHCGCIALRMLCAALHCCIVREGGCVRPWESLLGRVNRIVFCLTRLASIGYCVLRVL